MSETLGSTSVKMMSTPRCYSNKGTSINYVTSVKMLLDEGCGVECIKGGKKMHRFLIPSRDKSFMSDRKSNIEEIEMGQNLGHEYDKG